LGQDASGQIHSLLHGEIYEPLEAPAREIANRYSRQGDTFAQDLNGSYAVLLVDEAADRILLITDRVSSRRILHASYAGGTLLSSRPEFLPVDAFSLDLAGLAWYLSNHGIYNSRSIFEGVRPLERASLHEVTPHGLRTTRYWDTRHRPARTPIRQLKHEMAELLVKGVERCLYDHPEVFVSLSGGYDATGIVGILHHGLGVNDVHCLSYVHGEVQPGSDAWVAAQVASHASYGHEVLQGFSGDLPRHILDNATFGHAQRESVDEVEAWKAAAGTFAVAERPVLLTGDNTFALRPHRLTTPQEALASAFVQPFEVLQPFRRYLPDGLYDRLEALYHEDQQEMLASYPHATDLYDLRHQLYVDQRLTHHHMPWRESFAGRFVTVRQPYLDKDLLEFVTTVPRNLLRGKRLFRQTITAMYPHLFTLPRAARSDARIDLDEAFTRQADAVRALIDSHASKLDDLIPPDVILRLLERLVADHRQNRYTKVAKPLTLAGQAKAVLKKSGVASGINDRFGYYRRPNPPRPISASRLLMRLLVLRTALTSQLPRLPSSDKLLHGIVNLT
jgi:asparagine synthase (glutamine-hydrolysing)